MSKSNSFQQQYPNIHRFVHEIGWIEIGMKPHSHSFIGAYERNGVPYEGKSSYPSLEAALQDLEQHLEGYIQE